MLASSLIVDIRTCNAATEAASALVEASRFFSSQKRLASEASSNSSPMAPPVLKSSSIAARNFSRQLAADCAIGSFPAAEAASQVAERDLGRSEEHTSELQ